MKPALEWIAEETNGLDCGEQMQIEKYVSYSGITDIGIT
jgi:hypothetical protein